MDNLRNNPDGTCNCKPLGKGCFFLGFLGGACDCKCHRRSKTMSSQPQKENPECINCGLLRSTCEMEDGDEWAQNCQKVKGKKHEFGKEVDFILLRKEFEKSFVKMECLSGCGCTENISYHDGAQCNFKPRVYIEGIDDFNRITDWWIKNIQHILSSHTEKSYIQGAKDEREYLLNQKSNNHDKEVRKQFTAELKERVKKMRMTQKNEAVGSFTLRMFGKHPILRNSDVARSGYDIAIYDVLSLL